MARSFNVSYRFLAKDSFTAVSKKIKNSNKKLGNSFKGLSDKMKRSDNTFKKTSSSFIGGFKGMAAAAIGFFGIKEFFSAGSKFQDAMADLSAITGATGEDLDNLRVQTLALAKATVTSQSDVAEGIKLIASAKPELLGNQKALLSTTKAVLLLKNTGIDLQSAVKATVGGLNAFGEGAEFASRNVNILAAGSKLGSSEISDTAEALKVAGPGAKAAGLSFLQLNAAIQTVAKGEIKGSQAGTALNAVFARLRLEGKNFKEQGLQGVFAEVKAELAAIKDPTMRAKEEFRLFGLEHAKVGLAILDNVELLGQFEKTLSGTNVAQQQADIRLSTFSSKFKKLGIIINDVVIKTFLRLEPIISKQVTAFTAFLETIDPAQVEAFGSSLGILVDVGVMIAKSFGIVLSVLKGVGTLIGEIVASIATLDFGNFSDLGEAFSVGGKLFGVFGGDEATTGSDIGDGGGSSTTDVNINMNAPEGVIQSIQSKTSGGRNTNVGINMATG